MSEKNPQTEGEKFEPANDSDRNLLGEEKKEIKRRESNKGRQTARKKSSAGEGGFLVSLHNPKTGGGGFETSTHKRGAKTWKNQRSFGQKSP